MIPQLFFNVLSPSRCNLFFLGIQVVVIKCGNGIDSILGILFVIDSELVCPLFGKQNYYDLNQGAGAYDIEEENMSFKERKKGAGSLKKLIFKIWFIL